MNADWRNRYETAIETARLAGQLALRYFRQLEFPAPDPASATAVQVEWKANLSPVTIADREAERALRESLLSRFPRDGFWGEEFGEHSGDSGYRWIIDPIDGTRNFLRGIPLWGTLVGLEYRGEMIAGVVAFPALGFIYRALRGDGAFRDDHRLHVSAISTLEQGQIFYSGASWFLDSDCRQAFIELCLRTQRQRGFGDCYGFVLVAQGAGEAMLDYGVHAWDVAALVPIIEEAGGKFTDWSGQRTIHRPDVLASNGKVHDQILHLLHQHLPAHFRPETISHETRIT
jgi:histidinol-phosphatase